MSGESRTGAVRALALAAVAFVAAFARSLDRLGTTDEAWFLQVVDRILDGEVLYRDVFFGATPLSVQLVAAAGSVLGSEVVVVKAFVALCIAATVLLACRIAGRVGLGRGAQLLLALAIVVYTAPDRLSPYSALSVVFLLAAFAAVVEWQRPELPGGSGRPAPRTDTVWLLLAGLAAGLAFGAKQNIGALALATVTVATWLHGGRLRRVAVVVVGFAIAVALVVLPVWWSGGLPGLVDYGFLGKGDYLRYGAASYLDGLADYRKLLRAPTSLRDAYAWGEDLYRLHLLVLPPLALAGLLAVAARARGPHRRAAGLLLLLTAAAVAGVYPRASATHLTLALPVILLALAYLGHFALRYRAPAWLATGARVAVVLWLLAWGGYVVNEPVRRALAGDLARTELPHFRGVWTSPDWIAESRADAERLRAAAAGGPMLLLTREAGFWYLVTGLDSPTPFDFPVVTAFGRNGEERIYRAIDAGRIRSVCMAYEPGPLRPEALIAFVRDRLVEAGDLGPCTLYVRDSATRSGGSRGEPPAGRAPDEAPIPATAPRGPLAGTAWRLVEIQSMSDEVGTIRPTGPARELDERFAVEAGYVRGYLLRGGRL